MSNEKIIDLADLQAQTEELVTAIDAKDAIIQSNAEDYADSCLLEAKDYADDQDASVLQDAKDYADSAASAAGSSAAAASVPLSQKGTPGGVAELDANGLVPSAQLPSFVDDVLEYQDVNAFPATGETGKIYVSLADNKTYRWSGSAYTEISASLALGTTDSTAGRGDWTYTGYLHAYAKGSQFASNLYKITTNAEGHVIAAVPVTKQDIVDLGIPGGDTTYDDATTTTHGLMSAADKAKLDGVEANANNYSLPTMSPTTKGGAKQGDGLSVEDDALNLGPLVKHSTGATDGSAIFGVQGEGYATQSGTPTPDSPQPIMVARGRNLYNLTSVGTVYAANAYASNQVLTIYGVAESGAYINDVAPATSSYNGVYHGALAEVAPNTTYCVSVSNPALNVNFITQYDANKVALGYQMHNGNVFSFTTDANARYVTIRVGFSNPTIGAAYETTIQLELGTQATPYVPYGHVGLEIQGKNVLPSTLDRIKAVNKNGSWSGNAYTYNGITWYVNDDLTIHVKGTASARSVFYLMRDGISTLQSGMYTSSFDGGIKVGETWYTTSGSNRTFSMSGVLGEVWTDVSSGATVDTIVYPQIEPGSTATAYQQYIPVTPVPIPPTGLAAVPDGTKDTLVINSAGHVGGVLKTSEVTLVGSSSEDWGKYGTYPTDGDIAGFSIGITMYGSANVNGYCSVYPVSLSNSQVDSCRLSADNNRAYLFGIQRLVGITTVADFRTWLATHPITIRYPVTPTTWDGGYIDFPDLPEGATVTIPELENVGIDYWISGIPEVAEYGQAMQARLQGEIDEAEQQVVDLAEMLGKMIKLSSINTIEFSENGDSVGIRFKQDDRNYKDVSFNSNGISYTGKSNGGLIAYWNIPAQ